MQSMPHFSRDLTLLYDETKKKALDSVVKHETTPELSHLDRKLRIQKDRLITWGLEWTDQGKGPGGNIDESVARAGMTETVTSVLGNVQEVLEQAEKIKSAVLQALAASPWPAPEKGFLSSTDQSAYEDLLKDLTSSIDCLYEISKSRQALAAGSHPVFSNDGHIQGAALSSSHKSMKAPSFADSELTLVNPPAFSRPKLSPYAALPAILDPQALRLPAEEPPPYETHGIPSTTRMVARLIRSKVSSSVRHALTSTATEATVLVEFCNFDPVYRDTGVPPPLQRLESLAAVLHEMQWRQQRALTLLGYFEDPHQPRIGLVYDFLPSTNGGLASLSLEPEDIVPVSLLSLVQAATKTGKPSEATNATPFLEDRFRIALRIAEKLRDLHVEGFFHGNLHSNSVIFFQQGSGQQLRKGELHRPLLSSFDVCSRRAEGAVKPPGLNITKHPDDSSPELDQLQALRYDLYGLALLLLEIGLWTPLHDLYKAKYTLKDFKIRLEKIWVPRLAAKCGSIYMRAVQTCLRLSDDLAIGTFELERLHGNILRRLQRCCLLDEDEPIFPDLEHHQSHDDNAMHWPNTTKTPRKRRTASPVRGSSLKQVSIAHHAHPTVVQSSPVLPEPVQDPTLISPTSFTGEIAPGDFPPPRLSLTEHLRRTSTQSSAVAHKHAETLKESIAAATDSISNTLRLSKEGSTASVEKYCQKVTLIQSRWREICKKRMATRHSHEAQRPTTWSPPEIAQDRTSGHAVSKCRAFPVKLPQQALDDWQTNLGLRLSRIVERALKDSAESSTIDLVGLGHDPSSAKPTILVTCASTARVKAALRRKFDYDRSLFDLKVRKGRVTLSRGRSWPMSDSAAKRTSAEQDETGESDSPAKNPFWQKRPLCGASIGAYLPDHGHLDPVSYGGIIAIEREGCTKVYGMSVHHMLEPPSDDEDSPAESKMRKVETRNNPVATSMTSAQVGSLAKKTARTGHFEESDGSNSSESDSTDATDSSDDDDAGYSSSEFESDVSEDETQEELGEQGDTPGISMHSRNKIRITQPAFRDAWEQDLHADDASLQELDEDHLDSYTFGTVYASSGLRRFLKDGARHEIDWALLELVPPRIQPCNLVQGGARHTKFKPASHPDLELPVCRQTDRYSPEDDLYPAGIVPWNQLANLEVQCFGRASGLGCGTIGAAISFVKFHGRRNFSNSWSVIGGFGVGGDSGAWVTCNTTGRICGHVVAERGGLTYISPMSLIFEDIKRSIGATKISLPGGGSSVEKSVAACTSSSSSNAAASSALTEGVVAGALGIEASGSNVARNKPRRKALPKDYTALMKPAQMVRS